MKKFRNAAIIIAVLICRSAAFSGPAPAAISNQNLRVELDSKPFALRVMDRSGKMLLQTAGNIAFTTVRNQQSPFRKGEPEPWTEVPEVVSLQNPLDRIQAELAPGPGQPALVRLFISFIADKSLRVQAEVLDQPEVNRISLKFQSAPDDRYFGLGERFNSADQKGNVVYNWTQEGCLLGCKNTVVTYFPVPFYLNPRGYGFLIDDTHYSEFDFAKTRPDLMKVTNWNRNLKFIIFYGPAPLQVIENMTAFAGRVTLPPPWAFGTWVAATANKLQGAKNGPEHVRKVMRDCRENHIPCSAMWSEDWAWVSPVLMLYTSKIQWSLNRSRYPDYEQLAQDLHNNGFKFLGYFAPYLGDRTQAFKQGAAKGYLAKAPDKSPASFRWLLPLVGEPDLTNPAARQWWEQTFFAKAAAFGVDGWMHDFSEYTPAWTQFSDGRDGWAVHNDYPRLWALTAREFFDQARPDGDFVFFMRAGYTGSWKYAPVMWTGDQNTSWDPGDGIPSVIPAVNSVGISGSPITSTDIAGYHCIVSLPTDKELFFRWTQLGALLPVMRTHESSGCLNNWLFNNDRETLLHFKKYAALHVSLFPYIYTLAQQAADHGWPVVRHLMLQYPDDPGAIAEQYEFMLGDRLLVAPVLQKHAREREVYFPPGQWVNFWTGKLFLGPARVKVPALLEEIPLFVKAGTMLPTFASEIDTLVRTSQPGIKGFDDADQSLKVLFFGEGEDQFTLWDGTSIFCSSASQKCEFKNSALPRKYSYEFR